MHHPKQVVAVLQLSIMDSGRRLCTSGITLAGSVKYIEYKRLRLRLRCVYMPSVPDDVPLYPGLYY